MRLFHHTRNNAGVLLLLCLLALILAVGIVRSDSRWGLPEWYEFEPDPVVSEIEGVELSVSPISKESLTVSVGIKNNSTYQIRFLQMPYLQKKIDNEWFTWIADVMITGPSPSTISYIPRTLSPGDTTCVELGIEGFIPANLMEPGEYRMYFQFRYNVGTGEEAEGPWLLGYTTQAVIPAFGMVQEEQERRLPEWHKFETGRYRCDFTALSVGSIDRNSTRVSVEVRNNSCYSSEVSFYKEHIQLQKKSGDDWLTWREEDAMNISSEMIQYALGPGDTACYEFKIEELIPTNLMEPGEYRIYLPMIRRARDEEYVYVTRTIFPAW